MNSGDLTIDALLDFYVWSTRQWESRPSNTLIPVDGQLKPEMNSLDTRRDADV